MTSSSAERARDRGMFEPVVASDPVPIVSIGDVVGRGRVDEGEGGRRARIVTSGRRRVEIDDVARVTTTTTTTTTSRARTWFGRERVASKERETSPDDAWGAFEVGSNESSSSGGSARGREGGAAAGSADSDSRVDAATRTTMAMARREGSWTSVMMALDEAKGETEMKGFSPMSLSRRHSNLYVKNIPERVDELTLRKLFETVGEVQSCCVIRDVSTNKSRGFGFVKFKSTERAEDAIERFNGSEYLGKTLEVKFANTDGETDDVNANANAPPSDNVYVKGLPPSWSHDDLKSYFAQFGHIVECRLLHANRSTSSGALIRFLRESEATAAVKEANGRVLFDGGPQLVVRYAEAQGKNAKRGHATPVVSNGTRRRDGRGGDTANSSPDTNHLTSDMSQNSLTQLLSTFAGDEEDVAAVTALGSSHKFDSPVRNGQQSYDNPSWQKTTQGSVVAYVQNLPPTADELFLYKTFSPFGAITSVQVVRDNWTSLCTGIATIDFRHHADALTAAQTLKRVNSKITLTVQAP